MALSSTLAQFRRDRGSHKRIFGREALRDQTGGVT